jgi:hypothetical protein
MIEQLEQLLRMHHDGVLDRRQLLGALVAALAAPGHPSRVYRTRSALRRGRTLNHVTLSVADISRSKAFYAQLLDLEFKSNRPDQATVQLENGRWYSTDTRALRATLAGLITSASDSTRTSHRRHSPSCAGSSLTR